MQIIKFMGGEGFFVETKYDGDRIQLHKVALSHTHTRMCSSPRQDGSTYKYFTRSPKDYTDRFGATPHTGTHCPSIHHAFAS